MMGNRNWIIWSLAALCVLIVLGAMGVVTQRFLEQKKQDVRQGADAYREERVRLAMWRLDTLAASIVGNEDARPAEVFTSLELTESGSKEAPILYAAPPAYANLYWSSELDSEAAPVAQSSQVLEDSYVEDNRIDPIPNKLHKENLNTFNRLLEAPSTRSSEVSNFQKTCQVLPMAIAHNKETEKGEQLKDAVEDFSLESLNANAAVRQKPSDVVKLKNQPRVQKKISKLEKTKRRKAVERIADNYSNQWSANTARQAEGKQQRAILSKSNSVGEATTVTPFVPVWLNEELVLVRSFQRGSEQRVQGVWLNKKEVVAQLLAEIADLFPRAILKPYERGGSAGLGENAMLKLPFILVPETGRSSIVTVTAGELVDGPVGIAWLGMLVALVAGFFMLRAVLKMSERRAAFVSSVTHELRTPLTTFRLYSDMLSSGLVKDEDVQKTYLETLSRESERLTHLVENVLSYSQIERGSARAKIESVQLGSLIERFQERLRSRVSEEGMELVVELDPADAQQMISVDSTAVEQIVFNLVDNAAKYASGEECGKVITVKAELQKSALRIAVCDQGKGISRCELRRLFKPFHKSAEQAANTKPGVGLGLALCRRLARAMKGDLVYEKIEKGSCFVLKLPTKA